MKNKSKFLILIFICILIYKIFKKNREVEDHDETISDNDETISDNRKWYFLLFIIICILLVFFYAKKKKPSTSNLLNEIESFKNMEYMFYDDYVKFKDKLPSYNLNNEIDKLSDDEKIIVSKVAGMDINLDDYDSHINKLENLPTYREVFLSVNNGIPTDRDMYRDYPHDLTAYEVAFTRKNIKQIIEHLLKSKPLFDIINFLKLDSTVTKIRNNLKEGNNYKLKRRVDKNLVKYKDSISRIIEEEIKILEEFVNI